MNLDKSINILNIENYIDYILANRFNISRKEELHLKKLQKKDNLNYLQEKELEALLLAQQRVIRKKHPEYCEDSLNKEEIILSKDIKIWVKTGQIDSNPYIEFLFNGEKIKINLVNIDEYKNLPIYEWAKTHRKDIIDYWFTLIYSDEFYDKIH